MASVRGRRARVALWVPFAAGTTVGGLITGLILALGSGLLSPIPPTIRWGVALLAVAALVIRDLGSAKLALPQRDELIPQEVFFEGMAVGLFRFGVEYGTGWRTLIPSAAPYILVVTMLAANLPWWQSALIGAAFGFARAIAALQLAVGTGAGFQTFLSGHPRLLERAATVVSAVLVTVAAWQLTGW